MAEKKDQTQENPAAAPGAEGAEKTVAVLAAGVTQEQLDEWKAKFKQVYVVTVALDEHNSLTGYFKKPGRDVLSIVINLAQDKKIYEAREFLLNNTWIGGDKAITTNLDASVPAQTRLWTLQNFLSAEGTMY